MGTYCESSWDKSMFVKKHLLFVLDYKTESYLSEYFQNLSTLTMAKDSEPPPDPDTQQQPQVPSTGVSTAPDGITTTSPPILGGGAGGSGTSAAGGSGSQVAITKTSASGQPPSTMSLQQDAVQGILKSGLLTDPLQIAALQQ